MKKLFFAVPTLCFAFLMASASNGLAQGKFPMRFHHPGLGSPAVTAPAPGALPPASSGYSFTFINFPGQVNTGYLALNFGATGSKQTLVGYSGNSTAPVTAGFLLDFSTAHGVDTETFSTVPKYPGSTTSFPFAINNTGQIVGAYIDSAGDYHGYVLTNGTFTAINVPFTGAVNTEPTAINDEGDIVGTWGPENNQGFVLSGGVYTMILVPGNDNTEPYGINDSGVVVGAVGEAGTEYGFELSDGVYTTIQVPGSYGTIADAINNSGEIDGYYCPSEACAESSYVNGTEGFILNGGVYSTLAVPDAETTELDVLSDTGVVAGVYWDGNYQTALGYGFVAVPK